MHPVQHSSLGFRTGRGKAPFRFAWPVGPATTRLPGIAVCPSCRAVAVRGRWQWRSAPAGAVPHTCPACTARERGQVPYVIAITGAFRPRRHAIFARLRNLARQEMLRHPLERVYPLHLWPDRLEFAATGMHAARRVLAGMLRSFQREFELRRTPTVAELTWRAPAARGA